MNPPPQTVSRLEAAGVWLRIGLLSFGGPAGQMILMHKEIVEKRRWVDEDRYLHALNYCVLLPGPEAQQLATYLGWLLHGVGGGLVAGVLFVLPGALLMLVLSALYATLHDASVVVGLFFGVKAAVLALVTQALIRVGKRALKGPYSLVIAASSLLGLALFALPFPAVVFGSGVVGACVARWRPAWLGPQAVPLSPGPVLAHTLASPRRFVVTLLVGLALWAAPVLLALLLLGAGNVLVVEGVFFSQAAVLTFGGAYAVLAYVGQRAVGDFGWLQPHEMLDGIALAETTPGPLILVLELVAFLAAFRHLDIVGVPPLVAGTLGAAMMLWTTFVPSMMWVFLGAPFVERLRGVRVLHGALGSITAAVVGVIANLSLWLAVHALFHDVFEFRLGWARLLVPVWHSVDVPLLLLTVLAFGLVFPARQGPGRTLIVVSTLGCAFTLLRG